jgi:hypothetical protein
MTKILAEVLAANAKYAENFGNKGNLPLPPSRAPGLSRVRAVLALARIDLALRDRYLIVPPAASPASVLFRPLPRHSALVAGEPASFDCDNRRRT